MPINTQIQFKRDTAAAWTSNNPILTQGEIGYETDTGKFKLGIDGGTTWTSLPYGGLSGPQNTAVIANYGDGSDGNVTVNAGITTLVRDMFYANLTMTGGQIV